MSTPAQVGVVPLDSSEDAKNTAEYVRDAIAAEVSFDKSVGAIYKDQARGARSFSSPAPAVCGSRSVVERRVQGRRRRQRPGP